MKNLPNLLTIQRFLVLPIFVFGAYFDSYSVRWVLLILYFISSFTDFLDGYIARNYNLSSTFGRIFDPISDKALIIIILLMIVVRDQYIAKIVFIPFSFILARELLISGLREGLSEQRVTIKVSSLGKYKTTLQMLAVGFLIAGKKIFPIMHNDIIGIILLWIATIITVASAVDYIIKHKEHL
ncbi:CDP-diacylglycerol--glycerol-3-phosphate 3-phosphatidyltransferase [Rickettsiales bacterium LUAb2]